MKLLRETKICVVFKVHFKIFSKIETKNLELFFYTTIEIEPKIWKLIFLFKVFSGVRDPFTGLAVI